MWEIEEKDKQILRHLAEIKRELSQTPENIARKELWYRLDEGKNDRPLVLAESLVAYQLLSDSTLHCKQEWARKIEDSLRFEIFQYKYVQDDHVIEPFINCNWFVKQGDYGVTVKQHYAQKVSGNIASRQWDPPLTDLQQDLKKLHFRKFSVDREKTIAWKNHLSMIFDGILEVRIRGGFWWTTGMTNIAIDLVGLENFLTFMCTDPDGIHQLMAFLRDDQIAFINWLENEGLYSLNNENDYIGSGSMGYTHTLPSRDNIGGPVRPEDLWVLSESQETADISPGMFEEFVFQYQLPVIERFGAVYYGCCEPVHNRFHILKRLKNLRRVSISPWCDQEFMAEALGKDYVFSRKPNPSLISVPDFDETLIRKDLEKTLSIAGECPLEIIMKDVHTLCDDPSRIARWVELAFEAIRKYSGE